MSPSLGGSTGPACAARPTAPPKDRPPRPGLSRRVRRPPAAPEPSPRRAAPGRSLARHTPPNPRTGRLQALEVRRRARLGPTSDHGVSPHGRRVRVRASRFDPSPASNSGRPPPTYSIMGGPPKGGRPGDGAGRRSQEVQTRGTGAPVATALPRQLFEPGPAARSEGAPFGSLTDGRAAVTMLLRNSSSRRANGRTAARGVLSPSASPGRASVNAAPSRRPPDEWRAAGPHNTTLASTTRPARPRAGAGRTRHTVLRP